MKEDEMSEREKMISGLLYYAPDPDLSEDRFKAKELLYDFNRLRPRQMEERAAILRSLLGKAGKKVYIEQPFMCDYGYNIEVGESFYANHNFLVLDVAKVTIGDNVMIGPNVGLYTACHPLDPHERNTCMEFARPITIGNNVWIGGGVTVLPGVTIGDNAVIGGGSVVVKDIPANAVAVGNPCRVVSSIR